MLRNPQTTIALYQGTFNFETTHGKFNYWNQNWKDKNFRLIIKQKTAKTSSIYSIYLSLLCITLVYLLIMF